MVKHLLYLLFFVVTVLFFPKVVYADVGRKPTIDIDVVYEEKSVPDFTFYALLLGCSQKNITYDENTSRYKKYATPELNVKEYDEEKDCYWLPYPSTFYGGECSSSSCRFVERFPYYIPNAFKLAVFVPSLDKVFITNEIYYNDTSMSNYYTARLFSDGSSVIAEAHTKDEKVLVVSIFLVTILMELAVSLAYISVLKLQKKILISVIFANLTSLSVILFLFMGSGVVYIIISEIFAVFFESLFIRFFAKRYITLKQSFTLGVLNNLISFFIGGLIVVYIVVYVGAFL